MNIVDQIAKAEADLAKLKLLQQSQSDGYEADVEVTVCFVACSEQDRLLCAMRHLWSQGLRIDVLTALDEQSFGPTRWLLEDERAAAYWQGHDSKSIRHYAHIGDIPHRQSLEDTLALAKGAFLQHIQTDYAWWMDADVVLDPGTIRVALKWLKENPDVGVACTEYNLQSDHHEQGAMLMRTDLAREIGFDGRPDAKAGTRCVCMNIARDLKEKGLRVDAVPGITAWHRKWG